ncbi:hypothetical protein [Microvirga solisilvae]|uniref:hypothetical protein n=1 Tax=Microvirga solisilvae TaxID=2919498 RepID=UPI001FAF8B19|nr:hypothetical protein [Microvirga solisilvae]
MSEKMRGALEKAKDFITHRSARDSVGFNDVLNTIEDALLSSVTPSGEGNLGCLPSPSAPQESGVQPQQHAAMSLLRKLVESAEGTYERWREIFEVKGQKWPSHQEPTGVRVDWPLIKEARALIDSGEPETLGALRRSEATDVTPNSPTPEAEG